jgi:hypothetical protein
MARVQVANAIYAIPVGDKWIKPVASSAYIGDWPYADDGDRGLPAWFYPQGNAQDFLFNSIELYSDGTAVWTGGMGVIWKLPQGAELDRAELGRHFDKWCLDNL